MMKFNKKYALFFVIAFAASSILAGCIKADEPVAKKRFKVKVRTKALPFRPPPGMSPSFDQGSELGWRSSELSKAIHQMVADGSLPEKITFTGAQSPDDVFGSGRVDIKAIAPPRGSCVAPSCTGWKFLPVVQKNYGWYVYGVNTSAVIIAYLPGISKDACAWFEDVRVPKQVNAPFDPTKPGEYSANGGATTIRTEDGKLDEIEEGCFDNRVGNGPQNLAYYRVLFAK